MRIISRFQDYYDRAMAHGADQSRVFLREQVEYAEQSKTLPVPEYLKQFLQLTKQGDTRKGVTLSPFLVAFAGKLYPGVYCSRPASADLTQESDGPISECFYELEQLLIFCKKHDISLEKKWFFDQQTEAQRYAQFFDLRGSDRCEKMLAEHGIAVAAATHQGGSKVMVNPALKTFEFFRVFDAWQTYQELDMYLGALAAPDTKPPVQIADKDRIAQHGFNGQSFRKRSESKSRTA